jgi:RecA/RadA recombinase
VGGRVQLDQAPPTTAPSPGGLYFASQDKDLDFFSSGNVVLDCVLGGGWVLGRIANIVGDKSAGKTLLMIEANNNFFRQFPEGQSRYAEAEAAFDMPYAEALGMPVDRVDFRDNITTVEDLFEDLSNFVDVDLAAAENLLQAAKKELVEAKKGDEPEIVELRTKALEQAKKDAADAAQRQKDPCPKLYVVDSLDALSDREEQLRAIDKGSYGGDKPKKMGELFRRLVRKVSHSRTCILIVSQLRDKIGVSFGEQQTRTGGRALDFYASQVLWLRENGKLDRTISNIKRVIGVDIHAKCKKNKIGLPFRECEFPIIFGYGMDDMTSGIEFLLTVNKSDAVLKTLELTKDNYKTKTNRIRNLGGMDALNFRNVLVPEVKRVWTEVEVQFLPKAPKY